MWSRGPKVPSANGRAIMLATCPAPVITSSAYYRTDPIITVVGDLKIYPLDSYLRSAR